jgi:peptide/nickel transport system substrate-binding protein
MAIMFQMYNTAAVRNDLKHWTWNGFRTYYAPAAK